MPPIIISAPRATYGGHTSPGTYLASGSALSGPAGRPGYSPTTSNLTVSSTGRRNEYKGGTARATDTGRSTFSRRQSLIDAFDDPRAATLKGRTIAPYVHTDFAGTYENMDMYGSIFHFNKPEMEHAYYEHINGLFGPQLVFAGVFGLVFGILMTIVLVIGVMVHLTQSYSAYTNSVIALQTINLVVCLYLIFYKHIPLKCFHKRNELGLYLGLATTSVAAGAAGLAVLLSPDVNTAPAHDRSALLFDSLVTAYIYYLCISAAVSGLFPCRVRLQVIFLIILAAQMTAVIMVFDLTLQSYALESSITVVGVSLILGTWSWALIFFGSRCMSELRERVDFYQYTSTRNRAQKLALEMKTKSKKKKAGGATAVEDVLQWLKEAAQLIRSVESELQNVDLKEANKLLDETLAKLTNTGQLFKMNLDNVDVEQQDAIMNVVNAFVLQQPNNSRFQSTFGDRGINTKSSELAKVTRNKCRQGTVRCTPKAVQFEVAPPKVEIPACVLGDQLNDQVGRKWHLNLLTLAATNPNILLEVGTAIVAGSVRRFAVDLEVFQNLFYEIEKRYFANPYHNAMHGATVAHTAMSLCRTIGLDRGPLFDSTEEMTFIIACLGHDVGHPGRNNAFFVNVVHPIAVLYNDVSVLENFHCALLFELLSHPESNVYEETSLYEFQLVRSRIIDLVLATDMKQHFEGQSKFRVRRASPEFDYDRNLDDLGLMLKMCLKAADLSHGALEWSQHVEWSMRVTEEFYKQGDQELSFGLAKSPLCDRATHAGLAKSQKGFIEFVVHPLFVELDGVAHGMLQSTCMMRLAENKVRWEERASLQVVTPMPVAVSALPTHVHELKTLIYQIASSITFGQPVTQVLSRSKTFQGQPISGNKKKSGRKPKQVNQKTQTDAALDDEDEAPLILRGLSSALCNLADTPDYSGAAPKL